MKGKKSGIGSLFWISQGVGKESSVFFHFDSRKFYFFQAL